MLVLACILCWKAVLLPPAYSHSHHSDYCHRLASLFLRCFMASDECLPRWVGGRGGSDVCDSSVCNDWLQILITVYNSNCSVQITTGLRRRFRTWGNRWWTQVLVAFAPHRNALSMSGKRCEHWQQGDKVINPQFWGTSTALNLQIWLLVHCMLYLIGALFTYCFNPSCCCFNRSVL